MDKSDIFNEPALRGASGALGDSVNCEAVFGDASRPDVSDSGGIGDEPALSGAGAAAVAIVKLLLSAGFKNVTMCDRKGAIYEGR